MRVHVADLDNAGRLQQAIEQAAPRTGPVIVPDPTHQDGGWLVVVDRGRCTGAKYMAAQAVVAAYNIGFNDGLAAGTELATDGGTE